MGGGIADEEPAGRADDTASEGLAKPQRVVETQRTRQPAASKPILDVEQPTTGNTSDRLTKEELHERLTLASSGLVEELHALALRQNAAEDLRESRLDGKAQGLMATAGLSLTVTFTFGGLLLQYPNVIRPLGCLGYFVVILYAGALLLGLLASIWAVRALFVRTGYRAIKDDDVFRKTTLDKIDRTAFNDAEKAKSLYRRFITIQHWRVYRAHFDVHEEKADLIRCGQEFFVGFLVALLLIGGALTYSAVVVFHHRDDKRKEDAAARSVSGNEPTATATPPLPSTSAAGSLPATSKAATGASQSPSTTASSSGRSAPGPMPSTSMDASGIAVPGATTVPATPTNGSAATGANP